MTRAQSTSATQETQFAAPVIPVYPDSTRGLEQLVKEMLRLEKAKETKELASYVQSLILPDYDAWFRSAFGDAIGAHLSANYERTRVELPMLFPDILADLLAKHRTDPQATRFTDSCNPKATEYEYPILALRQNSQPFYDIRFVTGSIMTTISYFAYVDGSFRYLGNFQVSRSWPMSGSHLRASFKPGARVLLGSSVQAAHLIRKVDPVYPENAKTNGIQGTVLFHAIIGKDGALRELRLVPGGSAGWPSLQRMPSASGATPPR